MGNNLLFLNATKGGHKSVESRVGGKVMAKGTIEKLKKVARMFRLPYMVLVFDLMEMKKHNKENFTDDQLIDWMIEDLAEGMAS